MVSSRVSLQTGRSRLLGVELDRLDEAALDGTLQVNAPTYSRGALRSTRRRLGEQLDIARLGRARQGACRRASALEGSALTLGSRIVFGRKQHLAIRASSPGRIGVCREEPFSGGDPSGASQACVVAHQGVAVI